MAIDYRKEVDSGFDRKRIVESNIIALLKENIPLDIITESPEFNYRHLEMIKNLEKGYESKESQILETYGGYSKDPSEQIVPDRYSGVSHPVGGELYPMTPDEEIQKFKERDSYVVEIERLQAQAAQDLDLKAEKEKILALIGEYKAKFPIVDKIIEAIKEIDALYEKYKGTLINIDDYILIFKKYGLDPNKMSMYNEIYNGYKELTNQLSEISLQYNETLNGKLYQKEIERLVYQKNSVETEIVQRNTKLVNYFIRKNYGRLLIETDDLFQVCYIAMWEAAKTFDYKQGNKFSTYAFKHMHGKIKHYFKELTGYSWQDYWTKKKISTLLDNTSNLLGRKTSIEELVQFGFLSMSEKKANSILRLADEYSFSEVSQNDPQSYDEYEVNSQYAQYFSDDEIDDYDDGLDTEVIMNWDETVLRSSLSEHLQESLSSLNKHEILVLTLRYGLDDGIPKTLDEIGKIINLSKSRVGQIEAKALRKMRHPSRSIRLKDYYRDDIEEYRTTLK